MKTTTLMFVSQWGIYICDFYLHSILSHRSYMRLRNRLTSGYIPIACIEQTYLTSFSLSPPPNAFGAHRAALYYSVSVKNCAKRTPKTFISTCMVIRHLVSIYTYMEYVISGDKSHEYPLYIWSVTVTGLQSSELGTNIQFDFVQVLL